MKKLKITEVQYDRLTQLLAETPFQDVIKKTVKAGDIIQITYKNTVNNFKVIQNDNGQIIMDNIDAGSTNVNYRYFITLASLQGGNLNIKRVHKTKETDKLNNIKSWSKMDVKDITKIEVLRGGKVIDTVDTPEPIDKSKKGTESEEFKDRISDLIAKIASSKEGEYLTLKLTNGDILKFYINAIGGHKLTISLSDETPSDYLNYWESFIFNINFTGDEERPEEIYEKNKNLISTPDGGKTLEFNVTGVSGERTKKIPIKNIEQINITGEESNVEKSDEKDVDLEKKKQQRIQDLEVAKAHGNAVYYAILADPDMRKAFLHQPTFLNLIKIGDPVGIVPAEKLARSLFDKKTKEKFGNVFDKFKYNADVNFVVLDKDIVIPNTLTLSANEQYTMRVKNTNIGVEGKRLVSIQDTKTEKIKKPYEMEVLSPVEGEENTFIVRLRIIGGVEKSEENGKIKVLNYKTN